MSTFKSLLSLAFILIAPSSHAGTTSMASLSLGYGSLDVGAGSGTIYAITDANNQLKSVKISVTVGMLGMSSQEVITQDVSSLIKGNSLSFYLEGASRPILKISAAPGFSATGGKLNVSIWKGSAYSSQQLEVALGTITHQYYLWNNSKKVKNIHINTRGYSFENMYVGWYSITTY